MVFPNLLIFAFIAIYRFTQIVAFVVSTSLIGYILKMNYPLNLSSTSQYKQKVDHSLKQQKPKKLDIVINNTANINFFYSHKTWQQTVPDLIPIHEML